MTTAKSIELEKGWALHPRLAKDTAGIGPSVLSAVRLVRTALDDFYGSLRDEQKAQFNGIAPVVQNTRS